MVGRSIKAFNHIVQFIRAKGSLKPAIWKGGCDPRSLFVLVGDKEGMNKKMNSLFVGGTKGGMLK